MRIMLCNHQIHREVREMLCSREVCFSSIHDTGHIECNVPCFHGVDFAKTSLRFHINPFQYPECIADLWDGLVLLCKSLRRAARIPCVNIRCDGTMPRMNSPLHVNEDDLERGPLNCVFLLQPFNLLPLATKATITVVGGPLNDLWWDNVVLQRWTEQYSRQLETWTLRRAKHVNAIPQQQQLLRESEPMVWDITVYNRHCEAIMKDFNNTSMNVDAEMAARQESADPQRLSTEESRLSLCSFRAISSA
ncbi:uncharacterized protein PV07_07109 [Cladophialophora immunda]|uniref:Uncharacterized protein n=1 Tax=Cladophialophora immunda TaxID=569365 RepID=A0A0D2CA97_9EURO|nr:uncharacterized protein PV07_07109 [Cladophialophora immunda]KIW27365.1 hypothetical protein PV07_07109 [Cladophialophora immunda]